jgi:hypothetical protein
MPTIWPPWARGTRNRCGLSRGIARALCRLDSKGAPSGAGSTSSGSGWRKASAIAYFLAARLGLALLSKPSDVAVFWPASGIAGRSSKANSRPNHRSINQAVKTVSPASQKPLSNDVKRLLSLIRLAAPRYGRGSLSWHRQGRKLRLRDRRRPQNPERADRSYHVRRVERSATHHLPGRGHFGSPRAQGHLPCCVRRRAILTPRGQFSTPIDTLLVRHHRSLYGTLMLVIATSTYINWGSGTARLTKCQVPHKADAIAASQKTPGLCQLRKVLRQWRFTRMVLGARSQEACPCRPRVEP